MSQAVLISIRPEWCDKIIDGKKTIEIRKTRPKINPPFRCYIYMSAGDYEHRKNGRTTAVISPKGNVYDGAQMVIGEFVCDDIFRSEKTGVTNSGEKPTYKIGANLTCAAMTYEQLEEYAQGRTIYGWHISGLEVYDEPRFLGEFDHYAQRMTRPPQSWCYVRDSKIKPMRNIDRIRDMSDLQIANFIANEIPHGDCYGCYVSCVGERDEEVINGDWCLTAWYKWLMEVV